MGLIFNHRDVITTKEGSEMTDKELNKIADLIKERATFSELEEFKHLERREDRKAWVENQIAKLDKGEVLP